MLLRLCKDVKHRGRGYQVHFTRFTLPVSPQLFRAQATLEGTGTRPGWAGAVASGASPHYPTPREA